MRYLCGFVKEGGTEWDKGDNSGGRGLTQVDLSIPSGKLGPKCISASGGPRKNVNGRVARG